MLCSADKLDISCPNMNWRNKLAVFGVVSFLGSKDKQLCLSSRGLNLVLGTVLDSRVSRNCSRLMSCEQIAKSSAWRTAATSSSPTTQPSPESWAATILVVHYCKFCSGHWSLALPALHQVHHVWGPSGDHPTGSRFAG